LLPSNLVSVFENFVYAGGFLTTDAWFCVPHLVKIDERVCAWFVLVIVSLLVDSSTLMHTFDLVVFVFGSQRLKVFVQRSVFFFSYHAFLMGMGHIQE
jgi:hypothetical protein